MSDDAIRLVIVSHGRLAVEILSTARQILGELEGAEAVDFTPDTSLEELEKRIVGKIREGSHWQPAIVLVDLFGGSCANVAGRVLAAAGPDERGKIRVIAGFNLAMLVEFAFSRSQYPLDALADRLIENGRKACLDVNARFEKRPK